MNSFWNSWWSKFTKNHRTADDDSESYFIAEKFADAFRTVSTHNSTLTYDSLKVNFENNFSGFMYDMPKDFEVNVEVID